MPWSDMGNPELLDLTWETLNADVCPDEEVEHNVLEEPGLQPDSLPHDHPNRPLLRHYVPPEGPPSQVRYGLPGPSYSLSSSVTAWNTC